MRSRYSPQVRLAVMAIILGGLAGHVIAAFGGPFTWIVFWLLGAVLCPLLICFLTSRQRTLYGIVANLAMLVIPCLEGLILGRVWPLPAAPNPPAVSWADIMTGTALLVFSALLALAVVGAFESDGEA